ncbi:MAG: hypothetical protein HYX32_14440 [Actinobacteria bacterium]|nr:hypothetical protein [Actinomycetota bacterium]
MDLLHYLRTLRRRWRLVVTCALLGVAIGWAAGLFIQAQPANANQWYVATHTLGSSDSSRANMDQLAILVNTGEVPNRVADRLGGSGALLANQVRGKSVPQAGILQVVAAGTDPKRTVQLADTFAEELTRYQTELPDKQKQQQVQTLKDRQAEEQAKYGAAFARAKESSDPAERDKWTQVKDQNIANYNKLQEQIDQIQATNGNQPTLATLSTAEAVPASSLDAQNAISATPTPTGKKGNSGAGGDQQSTDPSASGGRSLTTPMRIGLGGVAGLLFGIILVLIIERLDPRLRSKEDAEAAFGYPVLAFVPEFTKRQRATMGVVSYENPRSRVAEAYRSLRSALLFSDVGRASDVTPSGLHDGGALHDPAEVQSGNGNGREPVAAGPDESNGHAAPAPPPRDGFVIMVASPGPAEGKTTTVANLAAVFAEAGYSVFVLNCDFRRPKVHDLVGGEDTPGHSAPSDVPGVTILTHVLDEDSGANPAKIVAMQRQVIREARSKYDVVLLDTAPLLATNDAGDVLADADQVLLIGKAGKTTKEAADRAAEFLEHRNAPVVGVLLAAVSDATAGYYYYYYGTTSYYLDEEKHRTDFSGDPAEGNGFATGTGPAAGRGDGDVPENAPTGTAT